MTPDSVRWWRRVLVSDRGEIVAGRGGAEDYLVLPGRSRPRIVTDRRADVGLRDLVVRALAQRRWPAPSTVAGATARILAAVGPCWSVSPGPGGETLREHLGGLLGRPVRLTVVVGPPRVNRKPVVRCYDGADLVAIAKLGPEPHTAALVDNEAHWLERLDADPVEGLRTPSLLHHGRYGSSALLVMTVLPVVSDGGVAFDEMPGRLLERFTERYRTARTLEASAWFGGLAERCGASDDPVLASALRQQTEGDGPDLQLEAWHGDWSPWNLGRTAGGEWCLWDWERATVDVPRGFDTVHRHVHYGRGIDAARRELQRLGLTGPQVERTVQLYLLELAARLVEGGTWALDENPIRRDLAVATDSGHRSGDA